MREDVLQTITGIAATRPIVKIVGNVSNLVDGFCLDGADFRWRWLSDDNVDVTPEPRSFSVARLSSLLSLFTDPILTLPPLNAFPPPLSLDVYLKFFWPRNPSLLLLLLSLLLLSCAGVAQVVVLHQLEHIGGGVVDLPVAIARPSHQYWRRWWRGIEDTVVSLRRVKGMVMCGWEGRLNRMRTRRLC